MTAPIYISYMLHNMGGGAEEPSPWAMDMSATRAMQFLVHMRNRRGAIEA